MAEISPLEWLGIAMATRAKEAGDRAKAKSAEEQALVNQRLTPYGGDISQYQKEWEYGYGPQQAASQQQSQQMYDYWMGLPAVLAAAQGESKGTGSKSTLPTSPAFDVDKLIEQERQRQRDIVGAWDSGVARAYEGARVQAPRLASRAPRAQTMTSSRSRVVRF